METPTQHRLEVYNGQDGQEGVSDMNKGVDEKGLDERLEYHNSSRGDFIETKFAGESRGPSSAYH